MEVLKKFIKLMSEYLTPNQFLRKHHIKPQTMRNYASQGMPHRKEKNNHISYPEQECLDWIKEKRKPRETPSHRLPNDYTIGTSWLCEKLNVHNTTVLEWTKEKGAPGYITPQGTIFFYPQKFLEWFRAFSLIHTTGVSPNRRRKQLEILEKEIPAFMAAHPEPETIDREIMSAPAVRNLTENLTNKLLLEETILQPTEQEFQKDPLVQKALANYDKQTNETNTKDKDHMKNNSPINSVSEIKPQFKKYDPCRNFVERDQVQIVLCNGRLNGIPQNLLYLTGNVIKNENSVGIVICSIGGNPEQIPASNLRLLRAAEDTPIFGIMHTGYTFYITAKKEADAVAFVSYSADSPLNKLQAQELAELTLQTINENNDSQA